LIEIKFADYQGAKQQTQKNIFETTFNEHKNISNIQENNKKVNKMIDKSPKSIVKEKKFQTEHKNLSSVKSVDFKRNKSKKLTKKMKTLTENRKMTPDRTPVNPVNLVNPVNPSKVVESMKSSVIENNFCPDTTCKYEGSNQSTNDSSEKLSKLRDEKTSIILLKPI